MISALIIVIFTVIGNNVTVGKSSKEIISETTYATLILVAAQARSSLIDFITVWKELATFKKKRRNFIIIDSNLASSGANKDSRSGNKYVIGGKKDGKKKRACEAKARNKNNKIKK
jgi:hypothetical protein